MTIKDVTDDEYLQDSIDSFVQYLLLSAEEGWQFYDYIEDNKQVPYRMILWTYMYIKNDI